MNEHTHRDETTMDKTAKIHPDYFRPIDHESDVAGRASRV